MECIDYKTDAGYLHLLAEEGYLTYCSWEYPDIKNSAHNRTQSAADIDILKEAVAQLDAYFKGQLKIFRLPLRLKGTLFQTRVWECLREIPYGHTISYGQLAQMMKNPKATRAVAGACGRNPVAIIVPCHRVIAADGSIGGYTGGIDKKQFLLNHEALPINYTQRVVSP